MTTVDLAYCDRCGFAPAEEWQTDLTDCAHGLLCETCHEGCTDPACDPTL